MIGKDLIEIVTIQFGKIKEIFDSNGIIDQRNIIYTTIGSDYNGWSIYCSLSYIKPFLTLNTYRYYNDSKNNPSEHSGGIAYSEDGLIFIPRFRYYCGSSLPIEHLYNYFKSQSDNSIKLDPEAKESSKKNISFNEIENIEKQIIIPNENKNNVSYTMESQRIENPKSILSLAFLILDEHYEYFKNMNKSSKEKMENWISI